MAERHLLRDGAACGRTDDVDRPDIQLPDQRRHVGGKLFGGVAVGRPIGAAGAALVGQDDVEVAREEFDLRSPAGADPAEAGDQEDRRSPSRTMAFVVLGETRCDDARHGMSLGCRPAEPLAWGSR